MRKRRGNGKGTFPTPFRGSGRKVREENLNLFEHEKFFYDKFFFYEMGEGREMRKSRGNGKGTFSTLFSGRGRKGREENLNSFPHLKTFSHAKLKATIFQHSISHSFSYLGVFSHTF